MTLGTIKFPSSRSHVLSALEESLLIALVAVCTNIMRGFTRSHLWLQRVSKSPKLTCGFQLVPLLLCFPCFHISNFFFKFAYSLNQRRALLINQKNAALGVDNFRIEFCDLPIENGSVAQTYHRLCDIFSCYERAKGRRDAS